MRYRGHLPEPLFRRLWLEREAVRKLLAERCRGRCCRCGAIREPLEIGGFDLAGWRCDRCLDAAGLLELARAPLIDDELLADEAEVCMRGELT